MFAFTKWIVAPVFAAGLLFSVDSAPARAEHHSHGSRGLQITIGGGSRYSPYGYQARPYSSLRPAYGYGGYNSCFGGTSNYGHGHHQGSYHDTSHFDYHPTEVYRHGNHYDIQPGHYDFHQEGHWHH